MAEGRLLVRDLIEHATQSQHIYTHHWRIGDTLIWDNRCIQRTAMPFDESQFKRDMRRATVMETDAVPVDDQAKRGDGSMRCQIATPLAKVTRRLDRNDDGAIAHDDLKRKHCCGHRLWQDDDHSATAKTPPQHVKVPQGTPLLAILGSLLRRQTDHAIKAYRFTVHVDVIAHVKDELGVLLRRAQPRWNGTVLPKLS